MALMCEEIRSTFFSSIQDLGDFTDYNFQTFVAYSQILLDFLTLWGSRFYIVKSDVDGNIKKVSNAIKSLNVTSLKDMLALEQQLNICKKDSSGSVGLLWLKRTYDFLLKTLWYLSQSDSEESMRNIILQAYDQTLRKYHNKFMRQTFKVVLFSLPKRAVFIKKLALDQDDCEQLVLKGATDCVQMVKPLVHQLNQLLMEFQLEDAD
ncbi:hypothetical protein EG68_07701 [Paragonimus skrjabini miyazakii]|uniref:Glycolipid transfer protein domain-containing protein n=1 Tax=Paragonimus skrjabini miyazakii TaxID=59628 RepID=A0A8S9YI76_9TREM|nr:hypothetical protein EG68_07701 [Paragonimus skrjabini miyazakii]